MTSANSNVDEAELRKFAEHAANWWSRNGDFKALHDINPLRLGYIEARVKLADAMVLDVGCGGGILTEAIARQGAKVTGIDLAAEPLEVARSHGRQSDLDIDYLLCSTEQLAEDKSGCFDVVTCMELLEHVPEPSETIAACASMLKTGGSAFFSTINRNPKSWLFAIVGAEYVLNLLPRGTHRYEKFIRPSELEAWCRKAGLTTAAIIGLHYNPLTSAYALRSGVDVNYIMHFRRINDVVSGTP